LLSNGDISTIFIAAGRVPSDIQKIRSQARGLIGKIRLFTGKPLQDSLSYGIGLSSGLARKLKVGIDSEVIAMAPTTDGQINALDARVMQFCESPAASLNDKLMFVSLQFAQSLYATDGVDRLVVLLKDTRMAPAMKKELNRAFTAAGINLEVKTWEEIDPFYTKVKNMFQIIFIFLFVIVLVIVVMSTINTMSMTVMERIKEIGTLRSLGIRRRGIILLFAMESTLLGIFGSFLGLGLTLAGWLAVKMAQPTWIPPHITKRVPIEVYLVPEYLVLTGFFLIALSLFAAVLPARKAARMNIVDALGHV
jgi:putative ABC transport system permease protein